MYFPDITNFRGAVIFPKIIYIQKAQNQWADRYLMDLVRIQMGIETVVDITRILQLRGDFSIEYSKARDAYREANDKLCLLPTQRLQTRALPARLLFASVT